MATASEIQGKMDKMSTNMDRFNLIVNGDESTDVTTDQGAQASIAKFMAEVGQDYAGFEAITTSWASLSALTGSASQVWAYVLDIDNGTHGQLTATGYDGTSVPNAGRYQWSATNSGWLWQADTGVANRALRNAPIVSLTTTGGTANAHTASGVAGLANYSNNLIFLWFPSATNTGEATLDINSIGPMPIRRTNFNPVAAGDIVAGRCYLIRISNISSTWVARLLTDGYGSRAELLENAPLSGAPTAPTPSAGSNSGALATTEWVNRAALGPIRDIASTGGTANAQTAPAEDNLSAYANNQTFIWFPNATNTTAAVTLKIGSLAALPVKTESNTDPGVGAIVANYPYIIRVSGAADQFRIVARAFNKDVQNSIDTKADKFAPLFQASTTGGTANAQTCDQPSAFTSYASNQIVLWFPTSTNTADNPTMGIGALGLLPIQRSDGSTVRAGEIENGSFYLLRNTSGTSWRIIGTGLTLQGVREELTDFYRLADPAVVNLVDWSVFPGKEAVFQVEINNYNVPVVSFLDDLAGNFVRVPRDTINSNFMSGGVTVFSAEANGRFLLRQMDADLNEIRDLSDGNGDYRFEETFASLAGNPLTISVEGKPIAPTCSEVRLYFQGFGDGSERITAGLPWLAAKSSVKRFSPQTPMFMTAGKTAFVGPSGLLGHSGLTSSSPLPSMRQALATGASTIVLLDGVYDAADMVLDGQMFGGVDIMPAVDAQPIIRGGTAVTGFTAVGGRTNVYQAACTTVPALNDISNPKGFVWVFGVPWSEISMSERVAAHRGRSHRSPHTPLYAGPTDLDSLEAASEYSWWWSANVLYVNAPAGVDPSTMIIRVPAGETFVGRNRQNRLGALNVTWEFVGLEFSGIRKYDLEGVTIIGAPVDGLSYDRVAGVDRFTTVIGSSNDNWNGHGANDGSTNSTGRPHHDYFSHIIEPCSILAWDDGWSYHERGVSRIDGGLFELCGSTGMAPAGGAEHSAYNTLIRSCGWDPTGDQSGIGAVNSIVDDGTGCITEAHNVVVEDCPYGFRIKQGGNTHKMILRDTKTRNCTVSALEATTGSEIRYTNHTDSGSAALKGGGGTFTRDDGTQVT